MKFDAKKLLAAWRRNVERFVWWWAGALGLVVLIVGLVFVTWPKYQELAALPKMADLEQELRADQASFNVLQSQIAAWREMTKQIGKDVLLMLPTSVDAPNLLVELDGLASEAGYQAKAIAIADLASVRQSTKVKGIALPSNVKIVKISLGLSHGNYQSFKKLLAKFESAWRILNVDGFSFGRDDSYTVELTSFYLP